MRLRKILQKEVRQFFRNRYMVRMALMVPILQITILSYAANTDVFDVPVAVCDEDRTPRSREFIEKVVSRPTFELESYELGPEDLQRQLDMGRVEVGLHIPPGFAGDTERGEATVQILVNGADSTTAVAAASYAAASAAAYNREISADRANRAGVRVSLPSVSAATRVLYNPDLRSMWFMAPGVMAMVLVILMQNFSALSIARERELGTLEQAFMTPARSWELLLGKLLPLAVVGLIDAVVAACIVVFVLHVPFRGSVPALGIATIVFLFASLGLGLVVSTVSANQQQAQITNFFLIFPSTLLSGFIFPLENLPPWLGWVSRVVPLTYYLEVIRGVFLRGSGLDVLFRSQIVPLAVLATVFFSVGALSFRKRLD